MSEHVYFEVSGRGVEDHLAKLGGAVVEPQDFGVQARIPRSDFAQITIGDLFFESSWERGFISSVSFYPAVISDSEATVLRDRITNIEPSDLEARIYIQNEDDGILATFNFRNVRDAPMADVDAAIRSVLSKLRGVCEGLKSWPRCRDESWEDIHITVCFPLSVTVLALEEMACDLARIIFFESLESPDEVFAVAQYGSHLLLGVVECSWLDAKVQHYGLDNDIGKHKLALDVAAFANVESGGLLVIGAKTTGDASGRDVISNVAGCKPVSGVVGRYENVLKSWIYPTVEGVECVLVPIGVDGRELLMIRIPPQPARNFPYIVRKFVSETGRIDSRAVTISRRNGANNDSWTAEEIHAAMSGLRAVM